jgi:hypothetical protein
MGLVPKNQVQARALTPEQQRSVAVRVALKSAQLSFGFVSHRS